jgi:hypothetical protein
VADIVPTKTQLDKLGERLRAGSRTEMDLRALDDYRRSFRPAYDAVVCTLRSELGIEATGRPAKTTASIVDKLECDQRSSEHGRIIEAANFLRLGAKGQPATSPLAKQLSKQADDFEARVKTERDFIDRAVQQLADQAISSFDRIKR